MSLTPPPSTGNSILDRWLVILLQAVRAVDSTSNIPVSRLDGGTNADATTFWRGDGSWQVVSTTVSNVISSPTMIPTDTSYIVSSYLKIESDLTINGNLEVI